jgi:hypothetical protein
VTIYDVEGGRSTRSRPVRARSVATVLGLALVVGACGSTGNNSAPTSTQPPITSAPTSTSTSTTSTSTTTTSTTVPLKLLSGTQTVLSPIGLNVRAKPSKSAAVIGTAAQGTPLQLLAHTDRAGGWDMVQGGTATGWVSADPTYSARGRFGAYASTPFSVLYPAAWAYTGSPAAGVTFRSPSTSEKVVIMAASSASKLPSVGHGAGVSQTSSRQVVACGVTTYLFAYATSAAGHFLAAVVVPVSAHRVLGLRASLTSLAQLSTVLDFVNSLSFPAVVCLGPPPSSKPAARAKPTARAKPAARAKPTAHASPTTTHTSPTTTAAKT